MRIFVLAFCFFLSKANGQKQHVALDFRPVFGNESIIPGKMYCFGSDKNHVSVTVMKWYVSRLRCYRNGKLVFEDAGNYLIDMNNKTSLVRETAISADTAFDEIRFNFGIDDTINNEGVGEGDLDPTKGMYWTWQSGYINMKLEGAYQSGSKPAESFEFHLGGFLKPYAAFQEVTIHRNASPNLIITADVKKFFEALVPDEMQSVMSPGEKAVALSKKMALIFH